MKIPFLAGSLTLSLVLAACNSTPNTGTMNPVVFPPPVVPVAATSLDVTVDLTQGINASKSWKPSGETVYLTDDASSNTRHVLAQATLGTDAHAHLTLPGDSAVAPYLMTLSPTTDNFTSGACTVTGFNVSPASFRLLSSRFSIKTATSTTGYLQLLAGDLSTKADLSLIYVDQNVKLKYVLKCPSNGRENDTLVDLNLLKGWNVINDSTVTGGTQTAPVYTDTVTANNRTTGDVQVFTIGSFTTTAPNP